MTNKKYKILIMSAPIGSGHALAAEALKDEFKKLTERTVLFEKNNKCCRCCNIR